MSTKNDDEYNIGYQPLFVESRQRLDDNNIADDEIFECFVQYLLECGLGITRSEPTDFAVKSFLLSLKEKWLRENAENEKRN